MSDTENSGKFLRVNHVSLMLDIENTNKIEFYRPTMAILDTTPSVSCLLRLHVHPVHFLHVMLEFERF